MKKNNASRILYKVFIYVALLALAISIIVPVAWVFMASVKKNAEFIGADVNPWALPKQFFYQNFIVAFRDAQMGEFFLNSVLVTATALILLLIIALPASYALSRFEFKGRKILNLAFMAGLFINVNYIVVPIFLMLSDANRMFHVEIFLDNRFLLALIYASTHLPFTIYLLSSYFRTLPKGFEEAAYIDGCGYFKTMTKIMIPMAKPSIITVILFSFLAFWNEYIIAYTLMDEHGTLAMGLKNLMAVERTATNYGIMYAGLVVVMLPVLILYICVQKQLTEGMTLGGLKG
ncbi:carbohydrate ABC transporter permease [Blautia hydrogenotrophica]|uniref:ABC transmembrane type-1 domain-containing protein n=1 Tax=Blautia hydrogenotrophica (strain DSM 10507 / JCM 14656 / S5a33) TaxID=476272 RepID=C0CH63_BLAHS|nr:carbohydrate ABC transporter permease [Blautia hydrogenotrophica]EEG50882.1 ABC transporter, permease protein [Blautia hydrogenotrophica DSM 10507]MCT6796802.1 carbohydrate ABC transporter permease [Blautia hydrogenotrophica]WPX83414.1 Diacetylchitobiose uptake system permease protein NgcG [Blautia hydrogenotrophica DSM 10507]